MSITSKRTASQREALATAREEAALQELKSLGAVISLHEPRTDDAPGTCTIRLYSTDARIKVLTGVSAQHVLDVLRLFIREQAGLSEDSPRRWELAPGPTGVPVFARQGSENASRERRVASAVHAATHQPATRYHPAGEPERI